VGRHRHAVTVRADGLGAVLGPLLNDPRVVAAALVDVDSGMLLDACAPPRVTSGETGAGAAGGPAAATIADGSPGADVELIGAGHAELIRVAMALPGRPGPAPDGDELLVSAGPTWHHLLRAVPDPHGDRLVLSVVVDGSRRFAERVRRRLRRIGTDALTAGPTVVRRPGTGGWATPTVAGPPPAPQLPAPPMPTPPVVTAPIPVLPIRTRSDPLPARRAEPVERFPPDDRPGVLPGRTSGDGPLAGRAPSGWNGGFGVDAAPDQADGRPGSLFEPSRPGPAAPGSPGPRGGARGPAPRPPAPFPQPPLAAPPGPPVPAALGRLPGHPIGRRPGGDPSGAPVAAPVAAVVQPVPSLFTPGADLHGAAVDGVGGPDPGHRDRTAQVGTDDPAAASGPGEGRVTGDDPWPDPRPPAPPSALPPGRSG
jgi:hypothetical protein